MSIPLGFDFKRTSPNPIDSSFVLSKEEMLAVNDNVMPEVYFATCKDDKKFYIYDKSATPSAETGKFREFKSGGEVDTEMSDTSINAVQNKVIKEYVDQADATKQDGLTAGYGIELNDAEDIIKADDQIPTMSSMGNGDAHFNNNDGFAVHYTPNDDDTVTIETSKHLDDADYVDVTKIIPTIERVPVVFGDDHDHSVYVENGKSGDEAVQLAITPNEKGATVYTNGGAQTTETTNLASVEYVDAKTAQATETTLGTVKLNPDKGITLNEEGQLEIEGGMLGQTEEGGLYAPISMTPAFVDKNGFLLSSMSGLSVANGSLALLRGGGVTVKSAPAGTTEYHVANTYANRLICAGLQSSGAVCIINEDAEASGEFSNILSCTINGAAFVPHTGPDDPNNDIIITVDKSANPNDTITNLRCYPPAMKSSSFYAGQMVGAGAGNLANVIVGQNVFSPSGNVVAMIAQQSYNTGNGNAIFGRYHNSVKNRWFMSGTGHDNTNGKTESGAVVGQYSDIKPGTLFAVGNGLDHLHRSNAFEITTEDGGTAKINKIEAKNAKIEFQTSVEVAPQFSSVSWNPNTSTILLTDFDGVTGLKLGGLATQNVNADVRTEYSIPVKEGDVITWSFDARKTSDDILGNLSLHLRSVNAAGAQLAPNIVKNGAPADYSTDWTTYTGTFTVPADMTLMRPRFMRARGGNTEYYEIKNFSLVKSVDSGLFLTSPNGTQFRLTIDDNGFLGTEAIL